MPLGLASALYLSEYASPRHRDLLKPALEILAGIPTVETKRITPPIANNLPHLLIFWDEQRLGLTRTQLKEQLAQGQPPIATARVHGTGEAGFLISVWTLQPGEDVLVAARLRDILTRSRQLF